MIDGVEFKELVTHCDERGFFREILREPDEIFTPGFGQLSHSLVHRDVVKAWHLHAIQTDWWYLASGTLRVGLCDMRQDSASYKQTYDFLIGNGEAPQVIKIPPGVAHGYRVVSELANVIYVTSHVYNADDELRIDPNTDEIPFCWMNKEVGV